ncbi:hypothetical protein [Desulfosarcina variabilis]|uniref:hypothetical protein n=1 Tax=Desulfosarcina variabilis TaxID=2300 RepID=UPI003AFABE79
MASTWKKRGCLGCIAVLGILLLSTVGWATTGLDAPITRSAEIASLAHLKKYYKIPNFKIGGEYDLDDPASFASGGNGGVTLESLGHGSLRIGYIALGTLKKD